MPTISMFYGIIIRMFYRDNKQHHIPHIHAEYQGDVAVFAIQDGSILDGSVPNSKRNSLKPGLKFTVMNYDSLTRKGSKVGAGKNWFDAACFGRIISSLGAAKYRIILAEGGNYPVLIETDDAVITIEPEK